MRVLLTGTTSQHISKEMHRRVPTFAGLLNQVLQSTGAEVDWEAPELTMGEEYLYEFDRVIVGVSSPASLAAYHAYGALSVVEHMYGTGRLSLFVDSPEPHRVLAGLQQVSRGADALLKPLYGRRKGFLQAHDEEMTPRLLKAAEWLSEAPWPVTYHPDLPWSLSGAMSRHIPLISPERAVPLQVDRMILRDFDNNSEETRNWVADDISSRWTKTIAQTLANPVAPAKAKRTDTAEDMMLRLSTSLGMLASVYRGGDSWWTPSVALALSAGTPVVSDWRLTSSLGDCWSLLATNIEQMSSDERTDLAAGQRKTYEDRLPDMSEVAEAVKRSL